MAGPETNNWIAERFGTDLAAALQSTLDEKASVTCAPGRPDAGEMVWWEQNLSCAPGAMLFVGASRESWMALGSKVLAAAGIEPTDEDARSTYQEVISQALSALADDLGARAGTEIHTTEGRESKGPSGAEPYRIELAFQDGSTAPLFFAFTPEVALSLEPAQPAEIQPQTTPEVVPLSMDLLLDVELPVNVVFGRADVRLQEILKLNTGSIIELDRTIAEPVDIVVNNCVVARGEVVVVDGNYGVRISEIVSRTERLRTSRRSLGGMHRHLEHR